MSTIDKAKERLLSLPKDYSYNEAKNILKAYGFCEVNKGKTSGSRVKFYREKDGLFFNLHKPHPGKIMKNYTVKYLATFLKENGVLE